MRKNKIINQQKNYSILALDDDRLMTETLQSYLLAEGYEVEIENDPLKAIERVRSKKYDILLLDFLMSPICGDEVVRQIRAFDTELFIILLTGHKSMAPPIKTIRELDIQGYYEKSNRFSELELLIETCVKSISQMRTIRHYRDGLRKILEQVPVLNDQKTLAEALKMVTEQSRDLLSCEDLFVYYDFSMVTFSNTSKDSDETMVAFRGMGRYRDDEDFARECLRRYHGKEKLPEELMLRPILDANRNQYGILAANPGRDVTADEKQLFMVYAEQVGTIISNLYLRLTLQRRNEELVKADKILKSNYLETVDAIRKLVDAKDFYTRGHSDRVSFYAVKIAESMGKSAAYVERIRVAGLFHDIGKVKVPDEILRKPAKLTEEEYAIIKMHPVYGREMLSSVSFFRELLPAIEQHHERYDGTGYPSGLAGEAIAEEARIISVADAFDAMTSNRAYRGSFDFDYAVAELQKGKNKQFDGRVVDVFLSILRNYKGLKEEFKRNYPELEGYKAG